ncbi:hypothetical protein LCGC14_1759450 [marine sediment metagenome]|uniref:Uncharacterized protein n=1 Tax=marine sediment metagenome TaxID=412755 RepID=A0A0F9JGM3_9ZZZZ
MTDGLEKATKGEEESRTGYWIIDAFGSIDPYMVSEQIAAVLNEPDPVLEGFKV